jgi:hypothetical protein
MRQDLAAVLSLAEDTAFLSGDGTANTPVGMSNYPGITSLTCASDSGNGGNIQAGDIFTMKLKMMQNNIPNDGWAFFCSPRTWDEIARLKDGQNRYLLETLTGGNIAQYPAYGTYPNGTETTYLGSAVGRLLGWPVFVTNNISELQTQGSATTASSLYLARMNDVIIAERQCCRNFLCDGPNVDSRDYARRVWDSARTGRGSDEGSVVRRRKNGSDSNSWQLSVSGRRDCAADDFCGDHRCRH